MPDPIRMHRIIAALVLIAHAGDDAVTGAALLSETSAAVARGFRDLVALAPSTEDYRRYAEAAEETALYYRAQEQAQRASVWN